MRPLCHACGDEGGRAGERCGRDLSEEFGLSSAFPCRGYYGLPLSLGQASARASVETNIFGHGERWRWKYVNAIGRIVTSELMTYSGARAEMMAWQRSRATALVGRESALAS